MEDTHKEIHIVSIIFYNFYYIYKTITVIDVGSFAWKQIMLPLQAGRDFVLRKLIPSVKWFL